MSDERKDAALELIRLGDWGWKGGGSKTRHQGEFGRLAAHALGKPAGLPDGWPHENGDEALILAAHATLKSKEA